MSILLKEPRYNVLELIEQTSHFDHLQPYNVPGYTKPLPLPLGQLPPLNFIKTTPTGWAVMELVEYATGTATDIKALLALTGFEVTEYDGTGGYGDYDLYSYPGTVPLPLTLNEGLHYLRFQDYDGRWVSSQLFAFVDGLEQRRDYIRLEWWNKEDLILECAYDADGQQVSAAHIRYAFPFKFWCYLKADLEDNDWQYEKEVEKRDGLDFVKSITRYKEFRFQKMLTAGLADALSTIPLHDKVEMIFNGITYDKIWQFEPTFKPVGSGHLKSVNAIIRTNQTTNRQVAAAYGNLVYAPGTLGGCVSNVTNTRVILTDGSAEYNAGIFQDVNGTDSQLQFGDYVIVDVVGDLVVRRAQATLGNYENVTEIDYSNWHASVDARPAGNALTVDNYYFAFNGFLHEKPYKFSETQAGIQYTVQGHSFGGSIVQVILKDAADVEWVGATVDQPTLANPGAVFDAVENGRTATAYKLRALTWQCGTIADSEWYAIDLEGVDFDDIEGDLIVYEDGAGSPQAPNPNNTGG